MPSSFSISAPDARPEGTGANTDFVFTVTRSGDLSTSGAVDFFLAPNSGPGLADSSDFTPRPNSILSGTLYFSPNQATQTFTVQSVGDSTVEPDEAFAFGLSNPRGGTIDVGRAGTTILNDDGTATPPVTQLSWGTASQGVTHGEGDSGATPFTYVLNRSGDTSGATSVDWRVTFGTANAQDFTGPTSGTVTFAPGELSKAITVQVAGDTQQEADETFQVALSNAPGASFPQPISGKILNDDGAPVTPMLDIAAPPAHAEGTGGVTPFDFTVTRSGDTSGTSAVDYYTVGDTNAADFSGATTGTLYFAAGETSKTIELNVVGDSAREADESFFVGLSNARGATLQTAKATTTILNDDSDTPPAATLSWGTAAGGLSQNEGDSGATPFHYVLNRSGDTSGTTTADWRVVFGTADAQDFTGPTSGTITFAPGETSKEILVQAAGDTTLEGDDTFTVAIANAAGATLPPSIGGKIINDDGAPNPATVSISGGGAKPEGTGHDTPFDFTVTRAGDTSGSTFVDYYLIGQTNAADFSGATTGTVYFQPGETSHVIELTAVGDSTPEPDESFTLGLSNVRGGVIGTAQAGGQILDDDGWVMR